MDDKERLFRSWWFAMNVVEKTTAVLAPTSISSWIDDSHYEEMDNQFLLEALGFTVAPVLDRIVEDIEKLHGEQLKGQKDGQLSLYLDYRVAVAWGCGRALIGEDDPSNLFYKTLSNYHRPTEDEEFAELDSEFGDLQFFNSESGLAFRSAPQIAARRPAWSYPHAAFDSRENYYAYRVSRFTRVSDPVRLVSIALTRFGNIGLSFYEDAFFNLSLKKVKKQLTDLVGMHGAQSRNFYLPSEAAFKQYTSSTGSDSVEKSAESDIFTSEELNRAMAAEEAKDWVEMLKAAKTLTRTFPDDPMAWHALGAAYTGQGKNDDAIAALRQAIELKHDFPDAWDSLGYCYRMQKKHGDAVAAYKQTVTLKPDYAEAWYNLGNAYFDQNKFDDAVAAYRRVTELKPDGLQAWLALGLSYRRQEKYGDAVIAYERAIKLKADDAQVWYKLGLSYAGHGKQTEALDTLDHLRKLDPSLADKLANLLSSK